jgi:uncharacterized protein
MPQVGKPVTGKELIGRENEISLLMEYLQMGQSVVLVAPRRFGKTSLVMEALTRLKKNNYYTAYVDVFANPTLGLLSSTITTEVLKNHKLHQQFETAKSSAVKLMQNIKLKTVLDDFQFIIGFADETKNEWELISESIDFVDGFSKKHHKKTVCAYDEFGDIGKFDPKGSLVKLFRSKIQQHKNCTYIFSGSYETVMKNMFISSKSPFYRLARIIRLGFLDKGILSNHLDDRFKQLKISVPNSFSEKIVEFTLGHPYYAQLALQQTVLMNAMEGSVPTPEKLLKQMIAVEKDYLEKVWEDISTNREYIYTLKSIAESGENIYKKLKPKKINVARAIKNLEGMGLLFKSETTGYYLSDPLLRYWILKH